MESGSSRRETRVWVKGPIIVGAGPSGLAVAASLTLNSIPCAILERSDTIASLWRDRTSHRLTLHLPKHFCELPHLPFPPHFPKYPTKHHFLAYLFSYAHHFNLRPLFRQTVTDAHYDSINSIWRVTAFDSAGFGDSVEYMSRWLVVATGQNAEPVVPELVGLGGFDREKVLHSAEYKTGEVYSGKKVLVIGCGNSGMEVCLDLCEHGAMPYMAVRSGVHVLPREMFGMSTFGLAMKLLKLFPLKLVDRFLLMVAKRKLGDTEKYGLKRPQIGPIELKSKSGKTPVLDVGAFTKIKSGSIRIVAEVESLTRNGAKLVDGREMDFDSVILATGYRSNVPSWLKDSNSFTCDGNLKTPHQNGWKGKNGLYCVGFTGKGLLDAGADAMNIAFDIARQWKNRSDHKKFVIYTTTSQTS